MTEEIDEKTRKQIRQDLKKLKNIKELFEKTLYDNTAESTASITPEDKIKDFVTKIKETIKFI